MPQVFPYSNAQPVVQVQHAQQAYFGCHPACDPAFSPQAAHPVLHLLQISMGSINRASARHVQLGSAMMTG